MRTHLPEKVRGTNLRDIKSVQGVPHVIYAPANGLPEIHISWIW